MELFKGTRMFGTSCTFLLAFFSTLCGLAQTVPTASQERLAQASRAQTAALLRTEGRGLRTQQKATPQPEDPWTNEQLIHPEELLEQMSRSERPLLLHIGVAFLFKNGHIPRSIYVGQTSKTEGIEKLKKVVEEIPLNREIVLYCGCCPWKDCPNIRPAFKVLRELRFTKVKVLYLPTSFAQDWVEKGLPVEKGESTGGAGA